MQCYSAYFKCTFVLNFVISLVNSIEVLQLVLSSVSFRVLSLLSLTPVLDEWAKPPVMIINIIIIIVVVVVVVVGVVVVVAADYAPARATSKNEKNYARQFFLESLHPHWTKTVYKKTGVNSARVLCFCSISFGTREMNVTTHVWILSSFTSTVCAQYQLILNHC